MKNIFKTLIFVLLLITSANAIEKDNIKNEMSNKIDSVLEILKKKDLSNDKKGDEIIAIIDEVFDYSTMAKISLGKEVWNSISEKQKTDFTKAFENKLKKSYIEKLDLYSDQKVQVNDVVPYKTNRLQLQSKLFGKDKTYDINYNFHNKDKNGNNWVIYDVDLAGVSIIQTYRLQFAGLLKEKSFDELLISLKQ